MKYEVGDKIIVLHSDEEGKVIEIINDKMVMIEVRGVRFPAYMDQIDFPYFKMFSQKKTIEKKKIFIDEVKKEKPTERRKVADGVFINFIPIYDKDIFDDDVVEKLKIYLINYNEESYFFKYNLFYSNESHFELNSSVNGLSDFYLHDILFDDLSDNPTFDFEFSLVQTNKKKAAYYERSLKIRGKQIFKKIEDAQHKNEPSFSYELFDKYPDRIDEPKIDLTKLGNAGFRMYEATRVKEHLPPARTVVDLHIEKLIDNPNRYSNDEIMNFQLNEFEKYLELAVLHHLSSVIFIHGIGEGILRTEIHERLSSKSIVKSFVNQYHPLYGYGATEVFLNL